MMLSALRLLDLADTVIEDEPTVPREDGRSARPDLQPLPRRHRRRKPVMGSELPEMSGSNAAGSLPQAHGGVRDPNALAIDIEVAPSTEAGGFFRASPW